MVAERKGGQENAFIATYAALKAEHRLGRGPGYRENSHGLKKGGFEPPLTSELRVEHALSERLSLQLVGRGTYDTDPVANSGRHDLQLVSALAVRF